MNNTSIDEREETQNSEIQNTTIQEGTEDSEEEIMIEDAKVHSLIGIEQNYKNRKSPSRKRKLETSENEKHYKTLNLSNTQIEEINYTSRNLREKFKLNKRSGVSPANRLKPLSFVKMNPLNKKNDLRNSDFVSSKKKPSSNKKDENEN